MEIDETPCEDGEGLNDWVRAYFHSLARTFQVEITDGDLEGMMDRMIMPSDSVPLKTVSKWEYAWFIFIKMTHEAIMLLDNEPGRKPTLERLASREQSEDEGD